jgi:Flp pilus assembly pilin Flp
MSLNNIKTKIARFHHDEDGLEAVQVVMIVAIAAIILVAVMTLGQEVFDWLREKWNELRGESIS